jgi:hypothetical protein
MRILTAISCGALLFVASPAWSTEPPRRLRVGAGAEVLRSFGDRCDLSFDLVSCDPNPVFWSFFGVVSYQPASWFAVGARFAVATRSTRVEAQVPASRDVSLWQTSVEPRVYPLARLLPGPVAPFLGLALGYATLRQKLAGFMQSASAESSILGGVIGLDVIPHRWFVITAEARLSRMVLGASRDDVRQGWPSDYTGRTWFGFGLQLAAQLPV